jgi:DNA excision repair protein ERCC-2
VAAVQKPVYSVQVRELVEFALQQGGLGGGGVFVGPQRALAGTRGHQRLQRARPAGYEKEVAISHDVETEELILRVQGRMDGLLATPEELVLEEIKTVQGRWDHLANPLHWAQAKLYGFMCAHQRALEKITLQLTYLDLETGELTEFRDGFAVAELASFFAATTAIYLEWVRERHLWCRQRDETIRALEFPFRSYRPGQRELAVAAYRAFARGERLFLEAPTGIGKTVSVLFPAVKAMGEGKLERLFYLTARTVGRTVAEKALADLRQAGLRMPTLTLTAKEKVCVQEGHLCDALSCPLAVGYYDRCKPAMREALARETITRPVVEAVGRAHQVCPFELSLDLSTWVDAVICDYNYLFDPKVYLRRHFAEEARDYGFLVDEAHNLADRAREMFSAEISAPEIREAQRAIKAPLPRCARALGRLSTAMRKLADPTATTEPADAERAASELDLFAPKAGRGRGNQGPVPPDQAPSQLVRLQPHDGPDGRISREFPAALKPPLEDALREAEAWLGRNEPAGFRQQLLEIYFSLRSFQRTSALYDERYVTIMEPGPRARVRLYCLDPSCLLQQALARGKAAVFFSATLTPLDYYCALLGGRAEDQVLQLPSPFAPEHLAVLVQDRIRTQFKARAQTLADVAQAVGALVQARPGNYLAYFPSYQYLEAVRAQFQSLYPAVPVLAQRPGMSEAEREAFLAAFAVEHGATLAGFAVMGGLFGEGIDLVGDRLIGAAIVGVGLPQLCLERDLIRDYFQEKTGSGFDYAYTFPGMNRVLQAIGRVIRSETDRGAVLLIDTRFSEPRYQRLFPSWWRPVRVRTIGVLREAARQFWEPDSQEAP